MRWLLLLVVLVLPSCGVSGRIFSLTTRPLTTNFRETPIGERTAKSDTRDIEYSYVRVVWNNNSIGKIARANGMTEVFYADIERLSILGIWAQEWVHIYGK